MLVGEWWPLNKDSSCCVPYFWRILFHGARNRGLSYMFERSIRKPNPRNESSKYAPTESFGGLNNKPSTSCHWFLCFGTQSRHQTRAPWLDPPRLKKAKSIFSNWSYSPWFRAPWKKIRQKYDIQQEPSLFKGHPLSCQYGDALCSMFPT